MRLVEVLYGGKWYRYLSNELDTERLPTAYLAANTRLLGILKRKRKGAHPSPLELIPILTEANLP